MCNAFVVTSSGRSRNVPKKEGALTGLRGVHTTDFLYNQPKCSSIRPPSPTLGSAFDKVLSISSVCCIDISKYLIYILLIHFIKLLVPGTGY